MIDRSGVKAALDKRLGTAADRFRSFRKSKAFKVIASALALAAVLLYALGLYANHKRLAPLEPEEVSFRMGERVAFGENYMGMFTTADGYYVTVTDAYAVGFEDYIAQAGLEAMRSDIVRQLAFDPEAVESPLPYLIVLEAVFENESCTQDWEQRLDTRDFTLFGADWYSYNLIEITHIINEELESSYFVFAEPGESVEVTLVFGLDQRRMSERRWRDIEREDVRLNLTYGPQLIDVVLELERR